MADNPETALALPEQPLSGVAVADRRIAEAKTAAEAITWTRIRGEIQRQEGELHEADRRASRDNQIRFLDAARQLVFLATGVGLIVLEHGWIGGFLAAASAYPMAKDFVMEKFPKISLPGMK